MPRSWLREGDEGNPLAGRLQEDAMATTPPEGEHRIALRPKAGHDDHGELDDIVVESVGMFRMEQMDEGVWWACCYLAGEEAQNRITFDIRLKDKDFIVTCTEFPTGVTYENG